MCLPPSLGMQRYVTSSSKLERNPSVNRFNTHAGVHSPAGSLTPNLLNTWAFSGPSGRSRNCLAGGTLMCMHCLFLHTLIGGFLDHWGMPGILLTQICRPLRFLGGGSKQDQHATFSESPEPIGTSPPKLSILLEESQGATMHVFNTPTRRGFLKTAAASAILLILVGSVIADDKSPNHQILGGKPADTSSGSSRYYDGHGRCAGRSGASGSTTRLYDNQGRITGRVDAPKDSTRAYDRSGSFAGRSTFSGEDTRFYDRKGSFNGRSTTSGNTTRFYDSHGAYSGRAETSGGTTRYYDMAGRYVGRKTR